MGKGALSFPFRFPSTRGNKDGFVRSCRPCLKQLLNERQVREGDFGFLTWDCESAAFALDDHSVFCACDIPCREKEVFQHVGDRIPDFRGVVRMFNP